MDSKIEILLNKVNIDKEHYQYFSDAKITRIVVNKQGTSYSRIAQVTVLPEGVDIEPMALTNGSHAVVLKADGSVWS